MNDTTLQLGGDPTGAVAAIRAVATELRSMKEQTSSDFKSLASSVESSLSKTGSETKKVVRDLEEVSKKSGSVSGAFKSVAASAAGMFAGMAVFQTVRAGLDMVVGGAIGMNAELEKSTLQFTTLMGDSQRATDHVRGLFEFAKKTPFETGPIIQASLRMQTFGGEALNTIDNLTLLGNASAATNAPIDELGFWVGRLYASLQGGQPFGESAMRLQELAVMTPGARREMEALQKSGASAEEVFAVFQRRLGEFDGAMIAQANTWDGLKSSISDAVNIMLADALHPLFDAVKTGASVMLELLGSDGVQAVFKSLSDSVKTSLGTDARGSIIAAAQSAIAFADVMLQVASVAESIFSVALNGLKVVVYGAAAGLAGLGATTVEVFKGIAIGASYLPGVGNSLDGAITKLRGWQDELASTRYGMLELTRESASAAMGQSSLGHAIEASRGMLSQFDDALGKAARTQVAATSETKRAAAAKSEFVAHTKEEEKAIKAAEKAADKFKASVTGMTRGWEALKPALDDSGQSIRNIADGLEDNGTLMARSLAETGALRAESLKWANENSMTLAPSIREVGVALQSAGAKSGGFSASLNAAMKDLPKAIQSSFQGGGDLGKSIGATFGASLFGEESSLTKTITGGFSKLFSSEKIGSAIGAMIPGVGTMLGGFAGQLSQKFFGKLFKSEGKEVNNLRDTFVASMGGIDALAAKAQAAGTNVDNLLRARNKDQLQKAIDEINSALGRQEADWELAKQAMDEWGISAEEAGQKFAQAEIDTQADRMMRMFTAAQRAGVDMNAIIAKGGDDFGKLAHEAIRTGTTIPAAMRPVYAAMIEAGTLIDANGEKFTDISQIPFAETIEGAVTNLSAVMKEFKDAVVAAFPAAFAATGAAGVDAASKIAGGMSHASASARELQAKVGGIDWRGMADEAIEALRDVEDGVNAVSFGHSPGGLKEYPLLLGKASSAMKTWRRDWASELRAAEATVNATGLPAMARATQYAAASMAATAAPATAAGGSSVNVEAFADLFVAIDPVSGSVRQVTDPRQMQKMVQQGMREGRFALPTRNTTGRAA